MDGYRDYFSQGGSSSADSAVAAEFNPSSQAPSYLQPSPKHPCPRGDMENLDLNSQADNFPFLDAYSGYLQSDGGHGDGTPLGRGGRSRLGEFLPPRPSRAGSRGGRGSRGGGSNSLNIGSGSGGLALGMAGRGRGRSPANLIGRGSPGAASSSLPTEDAGGHDGIAEEDNNGSQMNSFDKANWTEANTYFFCEFAVEQIRAGNCPNGTMSNRGYKIIAQKYLAKTGLWHDTKQLKNRWTQCKTLYTFHLWSQAQTGLGRNTDGTIIASDEWWRKNTEKRNECKKFKHIIPVDLDYLREMFHGVTVDGRSSCIPGEYTEAAGDAYGDESTEAAGDDHDGTLNSLVSTVQGYKVSSPGVSTRPNAKR